ncbi:tyrosine-type recombinase/integrase [Cytobacillus gottheilii]|uniref:Site-specific integrase n=1 Tax=Cytobacillus gottheilii TaxID=859144 RepID=A0ABX8FDS0_9BACI|nr:site-specific integrase [Cytobacillus gottheilii]QVY61942.1 site-specific integrase [Cytobacillus gottheilii]
MKGSYFKRGCTCGEECTCDNKWTFVIDVGKYLKLGKRKQIWRDNFDTREEAEAAAASLIEKIKQGKFHIETDMLFKEYTDVWLTNYIEATNPKPGTVRIRKYGINKFLPYFKDIKLKSITEEMYQDVLKDLKVKGKRNGKGLGISTLETIHVTGRLLFGKANDKKLLNDNPTINAYITRDNDNIINEDDENSQDLPKFLEVEELLHFLDIAHEKGLYMDTLIFYILSYTGMRLGELIALKWKDIDFDKHTISINKTYYNPKSNSKKYLLLRPKTIKSKRVITVDTEIIEMLEKHKEEQEEMISHLGDSYCNKGFIFANFNLHPGYPVLMKFVRNRMARLLKFSELNSQFTPHCLRHTHTSLLAQAEVEIDEIMDRLGHQDDSTTRRIYLHVTKHRRRNASNKYSDLIRSYRK